MVCRHEVTVEAVQAPLFDGLASVLVTTCRGCPAVWEQPLAPDGVQLALL